MKTVMMNVTRRVSQTESHVEGTTVNISDDLADYYLSIGAARPIDNIGNPVNRNAAGTALIDMDSKYPIYIPQLSDPSLPVLCIGGDHPYEQWWGILNDGLAKMYRDYEITPYLSINTDITDGGPGGVGYMTWEQVKEIETCGAEIMSHSHRHVHQYGRMDTGIRIEYLGVNATATVDIDGAPKTLVLAAGVGEGGSFDLTNASYDTLSELAAAISAVNGGASWRCTIASELTGGEESARLLSIIAPRSVKSPVAFEDHFTCGSGVIISYTGSSYKTAFVQVTTTNLDIYLDGVRVGAFGLTNASYDTLAELVAAIDALSITSLTADLCDDTGGIYTHYTQGDEKSSELVQTLFVDLRNYGGVVLDGAGKANGARFGAGLPHSYLIERQWRASVDAAAARGVTLLNWAQSGGGWHQYYFAAQGFRSYRTNQVERNRYPGAQWAAVGPDYIRTHYVLNSSANSVDSVKATLRAMTKSPGCIVDLLCHALAPAVPAGKNGYTIQASSSLNSMAEDDWLLILQYAKSLIDAGSLLVQTPEQVRRRRKWAARPQNLIFNSTFENDGTAITASSANATKIPGWELLTNVAHITAATVDDMGDYNAVSVTTNATTNADPVSCDLALERGKTYRIGARIKVGSYTSGNGVQLLVLPVEGTLPNQLPDDATPNWSSVFAKADGDLSMNVHVPVGATEKPRVRGTVAGTFNIALATNDTLSISLDNYAAVTVTLTAGAAQTASDIAADINAAFAASATFTGKQEYWTIASVQGNKVVVASPYAGEEYWNRITITGNGTSTVFGAAQCVSIPSYGGAPVYPLTLRVRGQMIGSWSVIKPYCVEVDLAY